MSAEPDNTGNSRTTPVPAFATPGPAYVYRPWWQQRTPLTVLAAFVVVVAAFITWYVLNYQAIQDTNAAFDAWLSHLGRFIQSWLVDHYHANQATISHFFNGGWFIDRYHDAVNAWHHFTQGVANRWHRTA